MFKFTSQYSEEYTKVEFEVDKDASANQLLEEFVRLAVASTYHIDSLKGAIIELAEEYKEEGYGN